MAQVKVKLFGVFRMDTHIAETTMEIERLGDIFPQLNERSMALYREKAAADPSLAPPPQFAFKDAIVYVNGERCARKSKRLTAADEIWLLSPASGG